MDIREVRASLRRHWALALVVVLLIPLVAAVYLANRDVTRPPARYTTSADVLIPSRSAERGELDPTVPPVVLQGQPELASSAEVTDAALEASELEGGKTQGINFANVLSEDKTIMTLSVSAPEPEIAARVLDEYLIAYQDGRRTSVRESSFDRADVQVGTIGLLNRQLADVERQLRAKDVELPPQQEPDTVIPVTGIDEPSVLLLYERNAILSERDLRRADYSRQITAAVIPGDYSDVVQRRSTARITPPPPSPLVPLLTIIGVGLLLAALIPVLRDRLDPTITEAKAAPSALRAGVLGTIPFMPRRLNQQLAPPGSTWELAFRSLAATSLSTDRLPKALMVTSPTGNTQARVAANFAVELAHLGVSVALIGTLPEHAWFLADVPEEGTEAGEDRTGLSGSDRGPGATLTGVRTLPELLQEAESGRLIGDIRSRLATRGIANLHIVPPGPEGSDLGTLDGFPPLLDALSRSGIDICVIAGPAYIEDPHATIMAWSTRHVLWAIEMGQVNKADALLAADRLELAGVTPFGVAIVNRHALRT